MLDHLIRLLDFLFDDSVRGVLYLLLGAGRGGLVIEVNLNALKLVTLSFVHL